MTTASPREHKTTQIVVKLTPTEKASIEARAAEIGLDAAVLLRVGWRWVPVPEPVR